MKFAAMNFHYIRYPLECFLDDAVDLGFRYVELWAAAPHLNIYDADGGQARRLKRELKARDLSIQCLTPEQCVYPVSLSIQDEVLRRSSLAYFKKTIDMAAALECERVLITPGFGYYNRPKEEAREICAESLTMLSTYAAEAGTVLVLECLLATTSNVLNSSGQLAAMLQQVESPALCAILDVNQMADLGESVRDYTEALKEKLQYVHFIDGNPVGHLALGDGNLPLDLYLRELDKAGYDGMCSLEICDRRYYLEPKKALGRSVEWLRARCLMN
jgi:protein FrlC